MLGIDQLEDYWNECEEIENKLKEGRLSLEDRIKLSERSNEILRLLQRDKEEKCYYT